MRKVIALSLFALFMMGAMAGGIPAAHGGLDGRTFGSVVGYNAQTRPLWLANHVSGGRL